MSDFSKEIYISGYISAVEICGWYQEDQPSRTTTLGSCISRLERGDKGRRLVELNDNLRPEKLFVIGYDASLALMTTLMRPHVPILCQ